ncbi:hypothetical protein L2735_06820 [Shewanella olleyana]|uniref:hypothetical protein n=1 Tax=Shewanella olleyana TaxID=135626 RepID=UPI00200C4239|nr:hypothetical protein [Shewanella olleyana]MCL1066521.1 hypothetical protein [Shewanella olleyana]
MTSIKLTNSSGLSTLRASSTDSLTRHASKTSHASKNSVKAQVHPETASLNVKNKQSPEQQQATKDTSSPLTVNTALRAVKILTQDHLASQSEVSAAKANNLAIEVNGKLFQIHTNDQIRQLIQSGAKVMLNADNLMQLQATIPSAVNGQNNQVIKQIVIVSQAIKFNLPDEILQLAKSNGVSSQQLLALATRPQGYPLPSVEINNNKLHFENGTHIMVSPLNKLPSGPHLAEVTQLAGQLQLRLSPIQLIDNVSISPISSKTQSTSQPLDSTVIAKSEPIQVITQFLKKLERIPFNENKPAEQRTETNQQLPQSLSALVQQPLNSKTLEQLNSYLIQHSKLELNVFKQLELQINQNLIKPGTSLTANQMGELKLLLSKLNPETMAINQTQIDKSFKSPFEVLNQNLSKAGALPMRADGNNFQQNLATQLLKLFPKLDPSPLTELANPALLKVELKSLASLNLSQAMQTANTNLSGGAITSLFQLLLGFKLQNSHTTTSPRLQSYINKLQQKMLSPSTFAPQLLSALDKAGSLESMTKLASSIGMYQQSSSDPNQNTTWYFALPYSVGQRDEQLEGKFEKSPKDENENDNKVWRLQLKFNLAQGPLLIMAVKQGEYLDLTFTGNNMQVLSKVEQYQASLSEKIQQAGLQARDISTKIDVVPATLLPGDHFLVKTNA